MLLGPTGKGVLNHLWFLDSGTLYKLKAETLQMSNGWVEWGWGDFSEKKRKGVEEWPVLQLTDSFFINQQFEISHMFSQQEFLQCKEPLEHLWHTRALTLYICVIKFDL